MTPRERVLAVLQGRKPDRVPLTIYETLFPQCAAERVLRNAGACIIERRVPSFTKSTPNCVTETHTYHQDGHERRRTVTHRLILGITEDMPEDRWQENLLAISEVINEMKGDGNP